MAAGTLPGYWRSLDLDAGASTSGAGGAATIKAGDGLGAMAALLR